MTPIAVTLREILDKIEAPEEGKDKERSVKTLESGQIALGRVRRPEEVAKLNDFLLGDESAHIARATLLQMVVVMMILSWGRTFCQYLGSGLESGTTSANKREYRRIENFRVSSN
jgi:hypothetical protein